MKKLLLLFLMITGFATSQTNAQMCTPDRSLYDSHVPPNYLFPSPYDSTTMMGGFPDTACIGFYFETVLHFVVPKEVNYNGVILPVTNIKVDGVTNLPVGLNYACTPSDCEFQPSDTVACVLIYGIATTDNMSGNYKLGIEGTANVGFVLPLNTLIAASGGGAYYVNLRDHTTSSSCFGVATENLLSESISIQSSPNPFSYSTLIEINSDISGTFDFQVVNMLGASVHREKVNLERGPNQIAFDGSDLAEGVYFYNLSNQLGQVGGKLMINR